MLDIKTVFKNKIGSFVIVLEFAAQGTKKGYVKPCLETLSP